MTSQEFTAKWRHILLPGCTGADIPVSDILAYLDREFEVELMVNPDFRWRQIKLKFGRCRIYCTSPKRLEWQLHIDTMLAEKHG